MTARFFTLINRFLAFPLVFAIAFGSAPAYALRAAQKVEAGLEELASAFRTPNVQIYSAGLEEKTPVFDLLAQRITPVAGAQTGQLYIGAAIAAGANGIIAGHSETRPGSPTPINDSDEDINAQIRSAVEKDVRTIILAIGEKQEATIPTELRARNSALTRQLKKALQGFLAEQLRGRLIVAYEPRWAIAGSGQGRAASPEYAQSAHQAIRRTLRTLYGDLADTIRIIYGGSANAQNAADFLSRDDIDGLLIGGASTSTAKLIPIVKVAQGIAVEKKIRTNRVLYLGGNQKTYDVPEPPPVFVEALAFANPSLVQIGIAPAYSELPRWHAAFSAAGLEEGFQHLLVLKPVTRHISADLMDQALGQWRDALQELWELMGSPRNDPEFPKSIEVTAAAAPQSALRKIRRSGQLSAEAPAIDALLIVVISDPDLGKRTVPAVGEINALIRRSSLPAAILILGKPTPGLTRMIKDLRGDGLVKANSTLAWDFAKHEGGEDNFIDAVNTLLNRFHNATLRTGLEEDADGELPPDQSVVDSAGLRDKIGQAREALGKVISRMIRGRSLRLTAQHQSRLLTEARERRGNLDADLRRLQRISDVNSTQYQEFSQQLQAEAAGVLEWAQGVLELRRRSSSRKPSTGLEEAVEKALSSYIEKWDLYEDGVYYDKSKQPLRPGPDAVATMLYERYQGLLAAEKVLKESIRECFTDPKTALDWLRKQRLPSDQAGLPNRPSEQTLRSTVEAVFSAASAGLEETQILDRIKAVQRVLRTAAERLRRHPSGEFSPEQQELLERARRFQRDLSSDSLHLREVSKRDPQHAEVLQHSLTDAAEALRFAREVRQPSPSRAGLEEDTVFSGVDFERMLVLLEEHALEKAVWIYRGGRLLYQLSGFESKGASPYVRALFETEGTPLLQASDREGLFDVTVKDRAGRVVVVIRSAAGLEEAEQTLGVADALQWISTLAARRPFAYIEFVIPKKGKEPSRTGQTADWYFIYNKDLTRRELIQLANSHPQREMRILKEDDDHYVIYSPAGPPLWSSGRLGKGERSWRIPEQGTVVSWSSHVHVSDGVKIASRSDNPRWYLAVYPSTGFRSGEIFLLESGKVTRSWAFSDSQLKEKFAFSWKDIQMSLEADPHRMGGLLIRPAGATPLYISDDTEGIPAKGGLEEIRSGVNLLPTVQLSSGVGIVAGGLEGAEGLAHGYAMSQRATTEDGQPVSVVFLVTPQQAAGLEELGVSPQLIYVVGSPEYPTLAAGIDAATRYLREGLGASKVLFLGVLEKASRVVNQVLANLGQEIELDSSASLQWQQAVDAVIHIFQA